MPAAPGRVVTFTGAWKGIVVAMQHHQKAYDGGQGAWKGLVADSGAWKGIVAASVAWRNMMASSGAGKGLVAARAPERVWRQPATTSKDLPPSSVTQLTLTNVVYKHRENIEVRVCGGEAREGKV